MSATRMSQAIVDVLSADLELAFEFYCAASEIVDDFEDYGPQLCGTEDGEYGESTPIGKLQRARNIIIERLQAASAERSAE
jgi:hypothetical protein